MSREDWYADDFLLTEGWVRDVETRSGLYRTAALRGQNTLVANRTGQQWVPKQIDQGSFLLNLWMGDDTREAVEDWWDLLLRAVAVGHRRVKWRRIQARGTERYCYGEVVQAIEPQPSGSLLLRASIEVQVPDGVWFSGEGEVSDSTVAGTALSQSLPLASFEMVTAPQDRLTSRVDGPIQNPMVVDVTDGVDGEWWTYDGVIAAGQAIIVGGGIDDRWALDGVGFVPDPAKLRYSGAAYHFVPPAPPGSVPTVELRGAGGGAGTRLTITGTPTWLV